MDARTVLLTANAETVYAVSHLDLKTDGTRPTLQDTGYTGWKNRFDDCMIGLLYRLSRSSAEPLLLMSLTV